MSKKYFDQMYDLSFENTGISTIDPEDDINCQCCDGEGCEVCNYTGLEYPEEY